MQQASARQIRSVDEVTIAFGLPDFLGAELKAGDRVTVQLLYLPYGYEPVTRERQMMQQLIMPITKRRWPEMTKRIQFALTDALLARRDNPLEAAKQPPDAP
jgi:hypothetical protein